MPPKKKAEKKPGDELEFKGPTIYSELLTKQIKELNVNLQAPDEILIQENVEFEILVERIEAQCKRLEDDNLRLAKIKTQVECQND